MCLLGFNDRAGLALARSLAPLAGGLEIITDQPHVAALRSKHCRTVRSHTPFGRDAAAASEEIVAHLAGKRRLLIPVNDVYVHFLLAHFPRLQDQHFLPYEHQASLARSLDKYHTWQLAREAGMPVPRTWLLSRGDALGRYRRELRFPCIVKPRYSACLANNQIVPLKVEMVADWEELELVARLKLAHSDLLLQEFLPGSGYGVNFSASRGNISNYFEYERLHEPGFGGGSSLRRSRPVDPQLRACCAQLLEKLDYSGIGMVEFRSCAGQKYFMEINARVWGSIAAPIFCGVDFPAILYEQAVFGSDRARPYTPDLTSRHLLKDLAWICRNSTKHRSLSLLGRELTSLLGGQILRRESLDVERLGDLGPAIGAWGELARRCVTRSADPWWRVRRAAFRSRHRRQCLKWLRTAQAICFVCRGNVIRSAFAAAYLQARLGDWPLPGRPRVHSAGTLELRGRPAAPQAVRAAQSLGIDLTEHRSQSLRPANSLGEPTVYLAMNEWQCRQVREAIAGAVVFPLGLFGQARGISIADPYLRPYACYVDTLAQITKCIEGMLSCLMGRRGT